MRELAELYAEVADLRNRIAHMQLPGTVQAVDIAAKTARLRLGGTDAAPWLSPWVRYSQQAGDLRVHAPPTVGQQMWLHSPGGEIGTHSYLAPYTWSDAIASPSDAPDQNVLTFGQVTVTITAAGLTAAVGTASLALTPSSVVLSFGGDSVLTLDGSGSVLKGAKVTTDGPTSLNNGTRPVVYEGSTDTHGDTNDQGEPGVTV